MTVKELKEYLNNFSDDLKVMIIVEDRDKNGEYDGERLIDFTRNSIMKDHFDPEDDYRLNNHDDLSNENINGFDYLQIG